MEVRIEKWCKRVHGVITLSVTPAAVFHSGLLGVEAVSTVLKALKANRDVSTSLLNREWK